MSVVVGDAAALPFQSGIFDAAFGFGVLHHVEDWRSGLAELARVLKPGATYCLEELYPGVYRNRLTRRILLHPERDRFGERDLFSALDGRGFLCARNCGREGIGILAVLVKPAA